MVAYDLEAYNPLKEKDALINVPDIEKLGDALQRVLSDEGYAKNLSDKASVLKDLYDIGKCLSETYKQQEKQIIKDSWL